MLNKHTIRNLAFCSLATALFGAGQNAFAHTSVKDQATEGVSSYNALQIGHTCELENGRKIPVIAQSVVFPTASPTVTQSLVTNAKASPATTQVTPTTLDAEITDPLGLAGKADLVQDKNIFKRQNEVYDGNGNLIGFNGTQGNLQTNLRGLVPFRISTPVPFFKATSCAKRMVVKIAVADICKKTFPPKPGTANLWMPSTTGKFTDSSIDGVGAAAALTINRDTTKNPLPAGCPIDDGAPLDKTTKLPIAGYDLIVTPTPEDIDAHLPIKGYWGR